MIKRLLTAICLIGITSVIAIANGETIELGPASLSMDLESLGFYSIEMGAVTSTEHKDPDFVYEIIPASIQVGETYGVLQVEVHKMSTTEPLDDPISGRHQENGLEHCIERSNLLPAGEDIKTESFEIDGQQGLIATIGQEVQDPQYIVAYSPDKEDGSGSLVCIVASRLPWETTEELFRSIKTVVE